jgi:ribonuclease Z
VNHLFLTSNKWHNISGISGLVLNRFDSGVRELSLHGIDCKQTIDFCTHFDFKLKNFNYNLFEINLKSEPFSDDLIKISSVPIISKKLITIAYICKLHPKRGVLLIDKCFQMKIPRKFVPNLQLWESVVLENGLTISPEEVHSPEEPERTFVVLECPSISFIDSFLSNSQLKKHLNESKNLIECVVHFTPNDVIDNSNYELIINQFSPQTHHLIINEQNPSSSLYSMHRFQNQLNSLDSKIFPLLEEKIDLNNKVITFGKKNLIRCQTGIQYVLRPSESKGISFESLEEKVIPSIKENIFKDKDGNEREGFAESLQELKLKQKILENNSQSSQCLPNYPEVVFLGTASAQPYPIRNVSAILVNTSENSSILLDCGEDTFGQLLRFYGSANMRHVFNKLKAVFISHSHSDHHLGLIKIIKKHYHYTRRPLVLFIPPLLMRWIKRYDQNFEDISSLYDVIPTTSMQKINVLQVMKSLRLKELKAIPVIHCDKSFGILIETQDNYSIVYSGDAEPSDQLIENGQNCDLLIHEATVEDTLVGFARDHFHSTVSEAIEVGRKMNAKFTILTHFSQRYAKIPLIPDNQINNKQLGIAYDCMRVSIKDLNRLPLLLPTLQCLYAKLLDVIKVRETLYQRRFQFSDSRSK